MANATMPKDLRDYIPALADQGIPNVSGAYKQGLSIQSFQTTMPVGGVLVFATLGQSDMANASYQVYIQNHTDQTKPGTVTNAARTTKQITVVGPTAADILDVTIIGTLKGQLV